MAISYSWEIGELKCIPKVGSKVNVVKAIPYNYVGVDSADSVKGTISGMQSIQTSDLSNWTAYASLTKAKVEEWLEANLTVADLKTKVDAEIAEIQNPPSVFVDVPW